MFLYHINPNSPETFYFFNDLRFAFPSGTYWRIFPTIAQLSSSSQSPQVSNPLDLTQFRISHSSQCPNLTPASLHPVQLIISSEISGELNCILHFSAVFSRNSLSLFIVAVLASQETQSMPQHAISFSIIIKFLYFVIFRRVLLILKQTDKQCNVKQCYYNS